MWHKRCVIYRVMDTLCIFFEFYWLNLRLLRRIMLKKWLILATARDLTKELCLARRTSSSRGG